MIDGRLLAPAAAAWVGAAVTLAWTPVVGVLLAMTLGGAALLLGARGFTSTTQIAGLAGVFVLLGTGAAALQSQSLSPSPLDSWIDQRASAVVVGTVAGEPRQHRPAATGQWWDQGSATVRVMARSIEARGEVLVVSLPMRLRVPLDAAVPPRGTVLSVSGRLAATDASSGLALEIRAGGSAWTLLDDPGALDRLVTAMRTALETSLIGAPGDSGALVMGLTIGDESAASPELVEAMQASGLAHLVAVSGGNVAIVVGVVIAAATLLRWPLAVRVGLGLIALVYYAVLVGPEPSVLRASVMGAVVLLGVLVGGRRGGPSVLAVGVLGLIVVQPSLALSWGFALSAGATAGLILLAPVLRERLARWRPTARLPVVLLEALSLTLAAQLSTLPVLIAMGGAVGWVSVPANLAAMPAVAPVTLLGLAATVTGPWLSGVAHAAAWLAAIPAGWIARVALTAPQLPAAEWPVGSWPSGWRGLFLLAVISVPALVVWYLARSGRWRRQPRAIRRMPLVVAAVVLAVAVVRPPSQHGWPPPDWLLIMCDVGQGDALLLRAAAESAVVVDTGSDPDQVASCLNEAGVHQVPAVLLTHFHADHVRGLSGIFQVAQVGAVLATPLSDPAEQAALVEEVASQAGLEVLTVAAGDQRRTGDVTWRALWPRRIIRAGSIPNNASVVLLAEVGERTILLTGDIEPEAQQALVADVRVAGTRGIDVVKVPHHGSPQQSPDFAQAARAPIALVSVGLDNAYGHPAPETLDLYGAGGALILRTDLHGDVAVVEQHSTLGVVPRRGMLQPP